MTLQEQWSHFIRESDRSNRQ